jgi:hypothetical protein
MSNKLTKDSFREKWEWTDKTPFWYTVWEAVELHTAEHVAEAVAEALVPDWKNHKGCKGARIVYEYGDQGSVVWQGAKLEPRSTLRTYGNGGIEAGRYLVAPTPTTRKMTDKELLLALYEKAGMQCRCPEPVVFSRPTLEAMAADLGIKTEVLE